MGYIKRETPREYYEDPLLNNLLEATFKKYRSYKGGGRITIVIQSVEEAERIMDFFGSKIKGMLYPNDEFSIELSAIEEEVNKIYELTIPSLYELLYGEPLLTNKEQKEEQEKRWNNLFDDVVVRLKTEAEIDIMEAKFVEATYQWFNKLRKDSTTNGYFRLRRGINASDDVIESLYICMKALWVLLMVQIRNEEPIEIPIFANEISGDSHILDLRNNDITGKLFLQALEYIHKNQMIHEGIQDKIKNLPESFRNRELYRLFNLKDDVVSSHFYKFTYEIYHYGKKETVNLSNVEGNESIETDGDLYLFENPSVFTNLVDKLSRYIKEKGISYELIKKKLPIIICTRGCAQDALYKYVSKCVKQNKSCVVYYSSDFDLYGIQMLEKMLSYFPNNVKSFKMDAKEYLGGIKFKRNTISPADRKILFKKGTELAITMAEQGVVVYQESYIDDYWAVLKAEIELIVKREECL